MEPRKTLQVTTLGITAYCFLRSWFSYLAERNCDVALACTATEFLDEIRRSGARIFHIPIARSAHPLKDLVSLISLVSLIRKERFDCVHTYTTKAGFIGRLAARLSRVPLIIHTIYDLPHNSTKNPLLRYLYILMERCASGWAHHLVTISHANLDEIRKQRIAPPEKVTVIHLGINPDDYTLKIDRAAKREALGIPPSAKVVGVVARLEAAKGHIHLLRAAVKVLEEIPESYFVIVGRGHLREKLEREAEELGIASHVIFTGFRDDMLEIMSIFDVFTLPSLWEGLGVVLIEAMALRKPTVASRVGGITDIVVDGETGILVPPGDPESLASGILRVLGDDEGAQAMGERGYLRMSKEFLDSMANEKMLTLYRQLTEDVKK
jgi:glycosyltransferase involved in cell wall biosynthesis